MIELELGIAQRNAHGETVCGDGYVIIEEPESTTVGVVDGLGHGPQAHQAAKGFCAYLQDHWNQEMESLLWGVHEHISSTRGAAAVVMKIRRGTGEMSYSGVGNVAMQAVSRNLIRPINMPGILGHRLRKLKVFSYSLNAGDLLAVFSDGISSRFDLGDFRHLEAQKVADGILEKHQAHHDDKTCLVVRCR